jgi:hypothetical protein
VTGSQGAADDPGLQLHVRRLAISGSPDELTDTADECAEGWINAQSRRGVRLLHRADGDSTAALPGSLGAAERTPTAQRGKLGSGAAPEVVEQSSGGVVVVQNTFAAAARRRGISVEWQESEAQPSERMEGVAGAAAVASFCAAVLTEICLCNVCSCFEILRAQRPRLDAEAFEAALARTGSITIYEPDEQRPPPPASPLPTPPQRTGSVTILGAEVAADRHGRQGGHTVPPANTLRPPAGEEEEEQLLEEELRQLWPA